MHLRRVYQTVSVTTLTLCCNPTNTVFPLTRLHHSVQLSCNQGVANQTLNMVKKDFLELVPLMPPSLPSSFVNELHCIEKDRPVTTGVQCSKTKLGYRKRLRLKCQWGQKHN